MTGILWVKGVSNMGTVLAAQCGLLETEWRQMASYIGEVVVIMKQWLHTEELIK